MLAVDTNVIVRLLTEDDPKQARIARALVDKHDILVLSTVLLETELVPRSLYGFPRERVHAGLSSFIGIDNVTPEEPWRTAQALDWFEQGMDFADAMHLAASDGCQALATFDRKLWPPPPTRPTQAQSRCCESQRQDTRMTTGQTHWQPRYTKLFIHLV